MNERTTDSTFRPSSLDARHLRIVVAIADEGGVTRASERLHLTQSALSHQLKQIETILGVALFVRAKKRLVLTDAGRELVARGRKIVSDISALEDDLRQRAAGWRGTLRLSTECYTCYEWLPPLLKRFHRQHPNIDVRIVAEATDNPLESLVAGEIDLAIVTRTAEDDALTFHNLFRDELLLIVSRGHRLAAKRFVRPADLENERLLLYSQPESNLFYQQFFGRSAKKPADVSTMQLTEAMLSMVRAGLGVTVAARWAVSSELASGQIIGIRLGLEGYFRNWMAGTRVTGDRPLPAYMLDFIDLVSEAAYPSRFAARASG